VRAAANFPDYSVREEIERRYEILLDLRLVVRDRGSNGAPVFSRIMDQ